MTSPKYTIGVIIRFWNKVSDTQDPDACWIWQGSIRRGYGCFKIGKVKYGAHRVSYEIANGPIPDGLIILHSCDVMNCVNPNHLSIGTYKDNEQDKIAKGRKPMGDNHWTRCNPEIMQSGSSHWTKRNPELVAYGEAANKSRLTEQDVIEIRKLSENGTSWRLLGKKFGITKTAIGFIVKRKTWKHI